MSADNAFNKRIANLIVNGRAFNCTRGDEELVLDVDEMLTALDKSTIGVHDAVFSLARRTNTPR